VATAGVLVSVVVAALIKPPVIQMIVITINDSKNTGTFWRSESCSPTIADTGGKPIVTAGD
jgi:hypothetical protein